MNILLLGSGGREHALAWKMAASPLVKRLYCAPGNAGIAHEAELLALDPADHVAVIEFCRANAIDLVVVGPEGPLCAGIVDDLAAGKGVVIANTIVEAESAIDMIFGGGLGEAGAGVVIEEYLEGEEATLMVLCDGQTAIPLASAQDHKRAFDNDQGPNTGGMGAYSPAPLITPALTQRALDEIVRPTLFAMKAFGMPYKGVLYVELMITDEGPKLIEFNVRFGDPECQVIMLRLMSDLLPALLAATDGMLKSFDLRWHPQAALCVVMAANGYPGAYEKGSLIVGVEPASQIEGVEIFHAGTAR